MGYVVDATVSLTTSSTEGATAYTSPLMGEVVNVQYVPDATAPFATTVDFAVTLERSGIGLWTESNLDAAKVVSPMQSAHSQVGVGLVFSSLAPLSVVPRPIYAAHERVKVVIAGGGAAKSGTFRVRVA